MLKKEGTAMMQKMELTREGLTFVREVDERLVSYNIEMTEVTGGTFWKEYTPAQIEGTEEVPELKSFADVSSMMQFYPPVDLKEENIRCYGKALGKAWVRVSGSWATGTYYDFDGHTGGKIPEGYRAVLTKEQWTNLLDFVREVDAKLLISVSNCSADHVGGKPWTPEQAKLLFDFSRDYGVPINAAEFMNEPNIMVMTPPAPGYNVADFCRDQDTFFRFVKENYPEVLLVGPCACGDAIGERQKELQKAMHAYPTEELMLGSEEKPDTFSYHCYAGISDRGASMGGHWSADETLSEPYLGAAAEAASYYAKLRDRFVPGAQLWVTESADAGMGGNTWGSTYLDVLRFADELGSFREITDGVIFHNTLASSDYGLLDHKTHLPRPNYWLCYVWNHLVGTKVYETGFTNCEGAHVYAASRKDGQPGYVYVVLNTSRTDSLEVQLPEGSQMYQLSSPVLRSQEICLNGQTMVRGEDGTMPLLQPQVLAAGKQMLAPATVTFIVV